MFVIARSEAKLLCVDATKQSQELLCSQHLEFYLAFVASQPIAIGSWTVGNAIELLKKL